MKKSANEMNLVERLAAPKPRFFRILRTIGLSLAAAGGAILASPIALPALLVSLGGYLTVAGTVATAISQATVDEGQTESRSF